MLDASEVAQVASTAIESISASGSGELSNYFIPPENPHTLTNLVPDLFNTVMVATLGLMGAYVTQVCVSSPSFVLAVRSRPLASPATRAGR